MFWHTFPVTLSLWVFKAVILPQFMYVLYIWRHWSVWWGWVRSALDRRLNNPDDTRNNFWTISDLEVNCATPVTKNGPSWCISAGRAENMDIFHSGFSNIQPPTTFVVQQHSWLWSACRWSGGGEGLPGEWRGGAERPVVRPVAIMPSPAGILRLLYCTAHSRHLFGNWKSGREIIRRISRPAAHRVWIIARSFLFFLAFHPSSSYLLSSFFPQFLFPFHSSLLDPYSLP